MRLPVMTIAFLVICQSGLALAEEVKCATAEDSLVVVVSRSPMGRRAGSGFVIGDGTLVVTAHHLVFEESAQDGGPGDVIEPISRRKS